MDWLSRPRPYQATFLARIAPARLELDLGVSAEDSSTRPGRSNLLAPEETKWAGSAANGCIGPDFAEPAGPLTDWPF